MQVFEPTKKPRSVPAADAGFRSGNGGRGGKIAIVAVGVADESFARNNANTKEFVDLVNS